MTLICGMPSGQMSTGWQWENPVTSDAICSTPPNPAFVSLVHLLDALALSIQLPDPLTWKCHYGIVTLAMSGMKVA